MFLRYFCKVSVPDNGIGDLGFSYFKALREAFNIRVIPTNVSDFTVESRWSEFTKELTATVPPKFYNVVCGDADSLSRLHLPGVKNIAIVAKSESEDILDKYDLVICSDDLAPDSRTLTKVITCMFYS